MTLLPIIGRELRVQARRPLTYRLRVAGLATLLLLAVYFKTQNHLNLDRGSELFSLFNATLFFGLWLVVPFLAADCISRERREGTLGLLFLTRLNARNIVLAKSVAHGLRALALWLAILPALVIPFLAGGVGWNEVVLSILINFSSLCLALAAGIIASACSRSHAASSLLAALVAGFFFLSFVCLKGVALVEILIHVMGRKFAPNDIMSVRFVFECTMLAGNLQGGWGQLLGLLSRNAGRYWFMAEVAEAFLALFILLLAIEIAAAFVRRQWRDAPASAARLKLQARFCQPIVWVGFFKQWMRRKLERNPIGWLEQRTVFGRITFWCWFALVICASSIILASGDALTNENDLQKLIALLLLGNLAVCAASSFRRERETGVMELLLVSPLRAQHIIGGRLRGLWGQFLPAFTFFLIVWIYWETVFGNAGLSDDCLGAMFLSAVSFLTLPVIGLYFSLRCRTTVAAIGCTVLAGIILPTIAGWLLTRLSENSNSLNQPDLNLQYATTAAIQFGVAIVFGICLLRDLASRNFAFQRAANG